MVSRQKETRGTNRLSGGAGSMYLGCWGTCSILRRDPGRKKKHEIAMNTISNIMPVSLALIEEISGKRENGREHTRWIQSATGFVQSANAPMIVNQLPDIDYPRPRCSTRRAVHLPPTASKTLTLMQSCGAKSGLFGSKTAATFRSTKLAFFPEGNLDA